MDLKEIIGKRIRTEREKRGFSQGKLAEAAGLEQSSNRYRR